jgi:hypothetical protein
METTRFSALNKSDWYVAFSTWCRGWDWWIKRYFDPKTQKLTRRWEATIPGVTFPPFQTKKLAYDGVTAEIRCEARRRANQE